MKNIRNLTFSESYKMRRPEHFSDSEIIYEVQLPKEQLTFELSQISKNQKQDEFETLCRRLAEKLIAPNLIPQVGPTGGGDGKTDSETYPVSNNISDRWFIPENGWNKDEKWAFAISAKEDWRNKAKSDVKKILETKREYTRVYFMTNQTPSSKKKKNAQDEFKEEFRIEVVILDGEWILEKIYNNDLIDLVVDSLSLSDVYKNKKTILGQNDAYRVKKLAEIEEKINSQNRYFEHDFQLVEDALEAAILSRMLEKPRDEVEGRFDRALRFCKKVNNPKQWIRLHYQRAWTYLNWYDDYSSFLDEYKSFKNFIFQSSSISEIELYVNLLNLLRGLSTSGSCDLSEYDIDIQKEKDQLYKVLSKFERNEQKPCSSLIAKTYKSIQELIDSISDKKNPEQHLIELSNHISKGRSYLDYPFDSFKKMIEVLGAILPNNNEFDNLVDIIASISEQRTSELAAGEIFLKRGGQKLFAKYYKESVVYFGKAVFKLAKEESQDGMYLSLIGLSQAYSSLGLIWASNNCLISASSISFKSWYESGVINKRTYACAKQLAINELFIGRVPSFLIWHELFQLISKELDINDDSNDIPSLELMDACFSVRIINTNSKKDSLLSYLPDILEHQALWLSQNSCLYKLGYTNQILNDYKGIDIYDEQGLDSYFEKVANQPFRNQMIYETNFLSGNELSLSSTILGCKFNLYFKEDKELLLSAETLLAFFESFLATSLTDVYPNTESINIEIIKNTEVKYIKFLNKESSYEYSIELNQFNFSNEDRGGIWTAMLEFISHLLAKNFFINNPTEYLEKLFKKEELNERLSLIFEHRNFVINILGDKPKLLLNDWIENKALKEYPMKRKTPVLFNFKEKKEKLINNDDKYNPEKVGHDKRKVFSIIDTYLWDQAKWKGFGFFVEPLGMGIFIAYENEETGKKIFDNWIKRVGKEDKNELIKITIVKGVDKNNPFRYRVHISSNIDEKSFQSVNLFVLTSRIHEMNASSSTNLNNLINSFNTLKQYRLCPAKLIDNGKIEPYFDRAILKRTLYIKNAWEIGEHDLERVVIKKNDSPIIPNDISDVPVLKLLKKKNEQEF